MRGPEFYEKAAIKKHLDSYAPAVWYFMPYMAGYGKGGVPDIVGCCYLGEAFSCGAMFAIEVKRPGKEPTSLQYRRMRGIEAAGGKTFWGTAAKVIPEFEAWIK